MVHSAIVAHNGNIVEKIKVAVAHTYVKPIRLNQRRGFFSPADTNDTNGMRKKTIFK